MIHSSHTCSVSAFITLLLIAAATVHPAAAGTDCFPDQVAAFDIGLVSSPPAFNSWQPGIVLGPPGDSTPTSGALSVVSLGHGGSITLEFSDTEIIDRPGPDFIVFENAFFCGAAPATAVEPYSVFAEPGIVAVSADGFNFVTFPFDAAALAQVTSLCTDRSLIEALSGLIGITPSFTGDYRLPDDPLGFDPSAPGGVSGHGGNAFDLADVGLASARFVRITDPDLPVGLPGASEGLDLDAVVAIHARPLPVVGAADSDGDRLSDLDESFIYLTDPQDPDSDGDLVPDGEEVAGCGDPRAAGGGPYFIPWLTQRVSVPHPTVFGWNTLGPGVLYDLVRGDRGALRSSGGMTDLGVVLCVENDSTDVTTRGLSDVDVPLPGEAFLYFVRPNGASGYGASTWFEPRVPASGDCP